MCDDDDGLARMWWDIVGPPESADDDAEGFLSLGGFSLAATQLIAQVLASYGVGIPLARLLRDKASLADVRGYLARLGGDGPPGDGRAAPAPPGPNEPGGRDDELAPSQHRIWLLSKLHPEAAAYNVVAALRLSGRPSAEVLSQALDDVIGRHEALRASVMAGEPGQSRLRWHQSVRGQLAVRQLPGPLTDQLPTALAPPLPA